MLRLLLQELRFRRGAMIGWGLGLLFFPVIYVGMYPSFSEQMAAFQDILEMPIYQAMGMSFAGFEGYVASTVTNLVPVILCVYAVMNGTGTLAGEEDNGRLELIVALPTPRWQIVVVKAVALGIALTVILGITSAGAGITLAAIQSQVETPVSGMDLFLGLMSAWPLAMAVGMISLFLGTFAPSRRIASMLAAVVVIVSYLGSNLTDMIESIQNIDWLFLWTFYDATGQGLVEGQKAGDVLVLLAVSLVALGLAVLFFQRRSITVGAWPWQKGKIPAEDLGGQAA